jgi:GTP-binding protein
VADSDVDNLAALFYEPIVKAKNGGHGMGKKMFGRSAPNKVVKVPVGTIVYRLRDADLTTGGEAEDAAVGRRKKKERTAPDRNGPHFNTEGNTAIEAHGRGAPNDTQMEAVADLTEDGQEYVLAKGGQGGKGNVHFKSSRNRAPREYTEGEQGEQGHFLLELHTIADAGLVGYPNAGKSTLLRKLSAARPKVAAYPFTTLHPVVGIVEFPGYRRATIADIPGLIEGAHRNVGLGHDFLRHITRCRLLLFVVDTAGSEGRSPIEDIQQLRKEIDLYDPSLSERPWFIVANKMDLPEAANNLTATRRRFPKVNVVAISAATDQGINELKQQLAAIL